MTEKWKELPDSDGKYMISNFANVAKKSDFRNGVPVKLAHKKGPNCFCYMDKGKTKRINLRRVVATVFGLPCEGTTCTTIECWRCGHNAEVNAARIERIEDDQMQEYNGRLTLYLHNGL